MATSIAFNNVSYTGNEILAGAYSTALADFTGTALLAVATTYSLLGTVTGIGSSLKLTQTAAGITTVSTAVFDGFYNAAGSTFYVFSSPLAPGGAFVVSSTGSVLTATTAVQPVTQSVPVVVCFLAGTLIACPDGEIAIERLQPGDLVATSSGGSISFSPVRWVGRGHVPAGPNGLHLDDAPIRILAGALGDALPARDLLVTAEHCLLLDGVLIPARMLVNHGSIISETGHGGFDFFHLELDRHAILIANGVEAESYLDTGNRANFHNQDVTALRADFASPEALDWPDHAAAPLAVDRATVEPIWNRLAERARSLGFPTESGTATALAEADLELRIVTEMGREILPTLTDDHIFAFVVPAGSGTLRLRSRSARPSDVVGPFLDDRRSLGVQIGRIGIGRGDGRSACETHLTADRLPGWHATEADRSRRWTDGDAVLPIDTTAAVCLDIEVVGVGPYRAIAKAA